MNMDVMKSTFPHLTDDDVAAVLGLAASRSYRMGETILEKGSRHRSIMIVREGIARVEQGDVDSGIALARLGPGQVLGDISFVEQGGATAHVRADQDVSVDVIQAEDLETLLTSDPGFSARFYRSLALVLAGRLRERSERLTELGRLELVRLSQLHLPRTGEVSERQLPDALIRKARGFNETMQRLEAQAKAPNIAPGAIGQAVAEACDGLISFLDRVTDDQSLLELSCNDPLAFREAQRIGLGIGDTIFRETYPFLMASAMIARCYMKPRGFSDDHETVDAVYRNEAEGDGALGRAVDQWFLSRPLCRSRRNLRDLMADRLCDALPGPSGRTPTEITSLASGTASEVFDLFRDGGRRRVIVTCVEHDDQALLANAARARRQNCFRNFRLVRADVMRLVRGRERLSLPPQDVIYALGLCEYLEDGEIVELLDWAHRQLTPGGVVMLSNLHPSNPDRTFMQYVLDWALIHRTEDNLRDVFEHSAFADDKTEFELEQSGANILVTCRKAP